MIPVENRIKYLFASDFNVSSFFTILLYDSWIVVSDLLRLSVEIKFDILVYDFAMID